MITLMLKMKLWRLRNLRNHLPETPQFVNCADPHGIQAVGLSWPSLNNCDPLWDPSRQEEVL